MVKNNSIVIVWISTTPHSLAKIWSKTISNVSIWKQGCVFLLGLFCFLSVLVTDTCVLYFAWNFSETHGLKHGCPKSTSSIHHSGLWKYVPRPTKGCLHCTPSGIIHQRQRQKYISGSWKNLTQWATAFFSFFICSFCRCYLALHLCRHSLNLKLKALIKGYFFFC